MTRWYIYLVEDRYILYLFYEICIMVMISCYYEYKYK